MRKLLLSLALCSLLAVPVLGTAQQTNNADVPDKADVIKFLDLIHAREQVAQTLAGMAKQIQQSAEEAFKQRVPDATPEQLAKLDKIFDNMFSNIPVDGMIDAIVPIYQKHLTKADLNAVVAFYASPAGQKILKEMPAILSESMQAGADIGRKAFEAKSEEMNRQIEELAKPAQKADSK